MLLPARTAACNLVTSIALRLGANICVEHTGYCGWKVERNGLYGLSCDKSADLFLRHDNINSLIKQADVEISCLPSVLKTHGLHRTDGNCADGITLITSEMSKQLVQGVTFVLETRVTANWQAMCTFFKRFPLKCSVLRAKIAKFLLAVLVKISAACLKINQLKSTNQCISLAPQIGNAACVFGTVNNRWAFPFSFLCN